MQVQISGQQIEVTEALRNHVESKLDKLSRHFDHLTSLTVVLSVNKLEHVADGTLTGSQLNISAKAVNTDMYKSIDMMMEKLVTQLRKHKEKITDHRARETRAMQQE